MIEHTAHLHEYIKGLFTDKDGIPPRVLHQSRQHGKGQNDLKRFFTSESCTACGELAEPVSYAQNQKKIDPEARFDGFYGICTDLEDNAPDTIRMNGRRCIIEDCFHITKTEFEARLVFLRRDDRIRAHFLTCFLALILYKYLAKKVNHGGKHFPPMKSSALCRT